MVKLYSKHIEKIVTNPKFFKLLGFTVLRSVLSPSEVRELRSRSIEWFGRHRPDGRMLLPRDILKINELYSLPFLSKIVSHLKLILGDNYVQWSDFQLQRNSFGGWHVDAGSENMRHYLFKKNYRFAKCGIYLQENSYEWGGGIGVRLFSHKIYNSFPYFIRIQMARVYKLIKKFLEHYVIIHPGDFVCFDSRIEHSSRFPSSVSLSDISDYGTYPLAKEHSKYVFYFNACNQESSSDFMNNSLNRGYFEEYLPGSEEVFFADYLSRGFPEDYPEDFVEKVRINNLALATPPKKATIINKEFLKELCSSESF